MARLGEGAAARTTVRGGDFLEPRHRRRPRASGRRAHIRARSELLQRPHRTAASAQRRGILPPIPANGSDPGAVLAKRAAAPLRYVPVNSDGLALFCGLFRTVHQDFAAALLDLQAEVGNKLGGSVA